MTLFKSISELSAPYRNALQTIYKMVRFDEWTLIIAKLLKYIPEDQLDTFIKDVANDLQWNLQETAKLDFNKSIEKSEPLVENANSYYSYKSGDPIFYKAWIDDTCLMLCVSITGDMDDCAEHCEAVDAALTESGLRDIYDVVECSELFYEVTYKNRNFSPSVKEFKDAISHLKVSFVENDDFGDQEDYEDNMSKYDLAVPDNSTIYYEMSWQDNDEEEFVWCISIDKDALSDDPQIFNRIIRNVEKTELGNKYTFDEICESIYDVYYKNTSDHVNPQEFMKDLDNASINFVRVEEF